VDCQICGVGLAAGSLQGHLETQYDVYWSIVLNRDLVEEHPAVVYRAIALSTTGRYFCSVANCVGETSTRWNLRWHFLECHPLDLVCCPSKGSAPLPRCTRCGMQTASGVLLCNHQKTTLCIER
jgi:hypothetical protein